MPINIKHVKLIKAVAGTHAATNNRTAIEAYDDITSSLTNPTTTTLIGTFDYLTPLRNASVSLASINFMRTREESFDKSFLNSTICASRALMQLDFTPIQISSKLLELTDDQIQQVPDALPIVNKARANLRSLVVDETNTVSTALETILSLDKASTNFVAKLQPWHLNLLSPASREALEALVDEHQNMGDYGIYTASMGINQKAADSNNAKLLLETSFITSAGISTGGFAPALPALTGRGFDLTSSHNQVTILLFLLLSAAVGGIAYGAQRFFKSKHEGETFVPMTVSSSADSNKAEETRTSSLWCYRKSTNI